MSPAMRVLSPDARRILGAIGRRSQRVVNASLTPRATSNAVEPARRHHSAARLARSSAAPVARLREAFRRTFFPDFVLSRPHQHLFRCRLRPVYSAAACAASIRLRLAPRLFGCGLRRGWPPSQPRLARPLGLVETTAGRGHRRLLLTALVLGLFWLLWSRLCFDSDSVGSISMAPWTTSGKYMVIGW